MRSAPRGLSRVKKLFSSESKKLISTPSRTLSLTSSQSQMSRVLTAHPNVLLVKEESLFKKMSNLSLQAEQFSKENRQVLAETATAGIKEISDIVEKEPEEFILEFINEYKPLAHAELHKVLAATQLKKSNLGEEIERKLRRRAAQLLLHKRWGDFDRGIVLNRGAVALKILEEFSRSGRHTVLVTDEEDSPAIRKADTVLRVKDIRNLDECLAAINKLPKLKLGIDANNEIVGSNDSYQFTFLPLAADGLHPGYGYFSENPELPRRLKKMGIIFVGPSESAMLGCGNKVAAIKNAQARNIAVVPGFLGDVADEQLFQQKAEEIGYPILLKDPNGGGGRGIITVNTSAELPSALKKYRGEVVLEKLLIKPEHLEFQVFKDRKDNVVVIPGLRKCDIQGIDRQKRMHIGMSEQEARKIYPQYDAMRQDAINMIKRERGYVGAGTVEFLVVGDDYYFNEVNTRLQVEAEDSRRVAPYAYSSTIELQIALAAGMGLDEYFTKQCAKRKLDDKGLTTQQKLNELAKLTVAHTNYSVTARIQAVQPYVENNEIRFGSTSGTLDEIIFPSVADGKGYIESGVEKGCKIDSHRYDAMIAQVSGIGATFEEARQNLEDLLVQIVLQGRDLQFNLDSQLIATRHLKETPSSAANPSAVPHLRKFNTSTYKEIDAKYKKQLDEQLETKKEFPRFTLNKGTWDN